MPGSALCRRLVTRESHGVQRCAQGQRLKKKFDSFDREGKGYLSRADIIGCIEHLGFDCDEDYCTQVLQTFSEGKDVMDLAGFTRMWEAISIATCTEAQPPIRNQSTATWFETSRLALAFSVRRCR